MATKEEIRKYKQLLKDKDFNFELVKGLEIYACQDCTKGVLTYYKDEGIPIGGIKCPFCGGTMHHTYTTMSRPILATEGYWYRPSLFRFLFTRRSVREQLLKGGLLYKRERLYERLFR